MPLATLKEVLGIATQSKTAIPGFNIDNIEIPEAIITAAEEYHCPVILTIGQGAIQAGQMHHLADVVAGWPTSPRSRLSCIWTMEPATSKQSNACGQALPLLCLTGPICPLKRMCVLPRKW